MIIYKKDNSVRINIHQSDNSDVRYEISAEEYANVNIKSLDPIAFETGDYVTLFGQRFTLYKAASTIEKFSGEHFEYALKFESLRADLASINFVLFDNTTDGTEPAWSVSTTYEFSQKVKYNNVVYKYINPVPSAGHATSDADYWAVVRTAPIWDFPIVLDPKRYAQMVVDNINRARPNETWTVGFAIDHTPMQATFSNTNCLDALGTISGMFETEFWIGNYTVNIGKRATTTSLTMQYGSEGGFRNITRTEVSNTKKVTRLVALGSDRNLQGTYRNGSPRLMLPTTYYLDSANIDVNNPKEETVTWDDIYPCMEHAKEDYSDGTTYSLGAQVLYNRISWDYINATPSAGHTPLSGAYWKISEGTVLSAISTLKFSDENLTFNPLDSTYAMTDGTKPKVAFLTGNLAGYEFPISNFDPLTKTITLETIEDGTDNILPAKDYGFAYGDQYFFVDLYMPQSYITKAENRLLAKATEYLEKYSKDQISYRGDVSTIWATNNSVNLSVGDLITVIDTDFGINDAYRIINLTRNITNPYKYSIELSQLPYIPSRIESIENSINDNQNQIDRNGSDKQMFKVHTYRGAKEAIDMAFDPEGNYFTDKIKPLIVETSQILIGTSSQQYALTGLVFSTLSSDPNTVSWTAGTITDSTMETSPRAWNIAAGTFVADADPLKSYYCYIVCPRATGSVDATISFSEAQTLVKQDSTNYYFLFGTLGKLIDGIRQLWTSKGFTFISGDTIVTGRIKNTTGTVDINLTEGKMVIGSGAQSLQYNVDGDGKLKITGTIEAVAGLIAGWTIGTDTISKGNVILGADGSISNVIDGVVYWTLNPDGSGSVGRGGITWNAAGEINGSFTTLENVGDFNVDGSIFASGAVVAGALNGTLPDDLPVATSLLYGVVKFDPTTLALNGSNQLTVIGGGGGSDVDWGTPTAQYTPLTVDAVTRNLSLDGHTHSYFLDLELKNIQGGDINHRLELGYTSRDYVNWYEYGGLWKFIQKQGAIETELLQINPINILYKGNAVWHAGNDGRDSGLDAGLLCGRSAELFFKSRVGYLGNINDQSLLVDNSSCYWTPDTTGNPNNGFGVLLNVSDNTAWFNQFGFGTDNTIYFRQSINSATNFGAWRILAFTDSNVASATKLSSVRTFELTGDVEGSITSDLESGVSISTTIQPNSVALGTDTTGNYLASIGVSGNGLSKTGTEGEGATLTVVSNATEANAINTIMYRDATGSYMATNGIHTGAVVAGALNGTLPDDIPVATSLLYGVVKFDPTTLALNGSNQLTVIGGSWSDVAWGTPTSQYSPLTINSVTRNLSLDGHTHNYFPLSGGTLTGGLATSNNMLSLTSLGDNQTNGMPWYGLGITTDPVVFLSGYWGLTLKTGASQLDIPYYGNLSYNNNTVWHAGNFNPSSYLSSFGGTLSGVLYTDSQILFNNNTLDLSWGGYINGKATINGNGGLNIYPLGNLFSGDVTINGHKVWHAGNDGAGSGLDADLLDGVHYQNILERHHSGSSDSGTATGWFRIGALLDSNGSGQNCILKIKRNYSYADNESYVFSISSAYNGGISITQLSGYANSRLIDKVRIDYTNSGVSYIELHIATSTTNNNYGWTTIGQATSYTTWTAVSDTPVGTSYEFTTVNGCKSDRGFTGNLSGNSSSATKLQTTRTIWGQNFNGEGNVNGRITFSNYDTHILMPIGYIGCNIGDSYFWNPTNHPIRFGTNDLERMRIAPVGNILIGTSTDSGYKLDVNGNTRSNYMLFKNYNDNGVAGYVGRGSTTINTIYLQGYAGNSVYIGADNNGAAGITINTSNYVGIGTTDPQYKLDVNGTFRSVGAAYLNSTLAVTSTSTFTGLLTANGGITSSSYITASRFYTGYDAGIANSFSCSNWFRSNGATGWLNATYTAGILSDTANIVRTYNTNKFKVYNTAIDSILTLGGVTAANVVSSGSVVAGALNGTLPADLPVATGSVFGVIKTGLSLNNNVGVVNINGRHYTTTSTYTDAAVREITAELALGTGNMTAGTLDQIQLAFAPLTTTRGLTGNIIATATGAGMGLAIGFRKDTGSGRWYLMIYNGTASTVVRDGILISIRGQQTV